eukprot:527082_1
MGSVLGSNATDAIYIPYVFIDTTIDTRPDLTSKKHIKRIQQLSCKLKLELIVNCWLRQVKITLFPIDIQKIIIDIYTYQYEFENPHYYPATKSDSHRYYPITKLKTEYEYLFKIIVIGNAGVGKTALQDRFTDDAFWQGCRPNVGAEVGMRTIICDGKTTKLQIWDTAGQERFGHITSGYYRHADAIILCYDLTDEKTLHDITQWNEESVTYGKERVARIMVGTKCDLENQTKCAKKDAIKIAKECDIDYIIETSAKKNINVEKTFHDIAHEILDINSVQKQTKYPFCG